MKPSAGEGGIADSHRYERSTTFSASRLHDYRPRIPLVSFGLCRVVWSTKVDSLELDDRMLSDVQVFGTNKQTKLTKTHPSSPVKEQRRAKVAEGC